MNNMTGDWFIDVYASVLEKLLSDVRKGEHVTPRISTNSWWISKLPPPNRSDVAAVDGGGGYEPLVGGSAFYITRAIGVFSKLAEPVKTVDVKLLPVRDAKVLDSLRAITENRAALRVVERLHADSILLIDGSYRALISAAIVSIKRAAYGYVSLASLYAGLFSLELLSLVYRVLSIASQKGVVVAYVSKDSGYRSFKEAVLLGELAKLAEDNGLNDLAMLALNAYNSYPLGRLREQLLQWRRRVEEPVLRSILDMILDIGYRDTLFIDDFTGGVPGYTSALELSLGGLYGASIEKSVNRMCARAEEYLGDTEAENCRGLAPLAVEAYQRLPATRMMYVRLAPGDDLVLVETLSWERRLASEGRRLTSISEDEYRLISSLVADYAGRQFYNKWLVIAHEIASLKSEQLVLYTKLFYNLAKARGVDLRLSRRVSMGVAGIV